MKKRNKNRGFMGNNFRKGSWVYLEFDMKEDHNKTHVFGNLGYNPSIFG